MSIKPSSDRQFTEKEVSAILQRAGELQAARTPGQGNQGGAGGTSLTQLQQAAAELGIDPGLIEQAANDVGAEETEGHGSRLLGGPWRVDSDRLVQGSVTEDNWPLVLDEMRAATGRVGHPKTVGKAFEWLSIDPDPLHITLTPNGENTRVRVSARFGQWGGLLYLVPTMLMLLATLIFCLANDKSAFMSPGLFASLMIGVPVATLLSARVVFGRLCTRKRRQTRSLIARMEQAISEPSQNKIEAAQVYPQTSLPLAEGPVTSLKAADEPLLIVQSTHNQG